MERQFLIAAMNRCAHNITQAAEEVGMQRPNFHALSAEPRAEAGEIAEQSEQIVRCGRRMSSAYMANNPAVGGARSRTCRVHPFHPTAKTTPAGHWPHV